MNKENIESLSGEVKDLKRQIDEIHSSRSWRLTSPYRAIGKVVARFRHYFFKHCYFIARRIGKSLPINSRSRMKIRIFLFGERNFDSEILDHHKKLTLLKAESADVLAILKSEFDNTEDRFYELTKNEPLDSAVKLIAFYLPQFHPFPENDQWWGKGFTEWTNVTKALPNYNGHYQPHLPIHLGFYDLRVKEVMEEQARLAKNYGVSGFNYYFYWFAGKTLMEDPLLQMLENPNVGMPFCLTWANENWTRTWDGAENDILIAQDHSEQDGLAFIQYIMKYFKDDRYIKVDGKPVLIIYRADIIPKIAQFAQVWRGEAKRNGFPGLYLISAQTFGIKSPKPFNFDASVEFPPHTVQSNIKNVDALNSNFSGQIYSYSQVVENNVVQENTDYKKYKTAMLGWDNTARKQYKSHIFHGFKLIKYKQWLDYMCSSVFHDRKHSDDEKLVFINAWNEWAEGTHLEPDRKFGYGYLDTTYHVIKNFDAKKKQHLAIRPDIKRRGDFAVIVHAHYLETLPEIFELIRNADFEEEDLFFTATTLEIIDSIKAVCPRANTMLVENRGRDILPFLQIYNLVHQMGYTAICKIHGKKSVYRDDGAKIRKHLFNDLIGSKKITEEIKKKFYIDKNVGLICSAGHFLNHNDNNMKYNHRNVENMCKKMSLTFKYDCFPAGSMFWFRPSALKPLLALSSSDFQLEKGLSDGTNAHAIERLFITITKHNGYSVETVGAKKANVVADA